MAPYPVCCLQGDGGSPLACPTPDGRYQVAGVVAWGVDCGKRGIPGLYASVADVRAWIDAVLDRSGPS